MTLNAVLRFVTDFVKSWHAKRTTCLARLVWSLMQGGRLGVAALARHIPTATTQKHHVKSVDRFLGNSKVDLTAIWEALLALSCANRQRIFIFLDWTDLPGGMETLQASVSYGGRSLPVAWATTRKGHYHRSKNVFETNLCRVVRSLLPEHVQLVIIADRGYCRAGFLRALRKMRGVKFIIRVRRDVHFKQGRGTKALSNRKLHRGQTRDLPDGLWGKDAQVPARVVLSWQKGRRGWPKSPWYLVTNFSPEELSAQEVVKAYAKRMRIEEGFRDHKSMRFGFQMRSVKLSSPERWDRLLLIAALAILLLGHIGAVAEQRGLQRGYKANTSRERTHSLLHLGRAFLKVLALRQPRWRLLP